ncbi:MAG: hypothetical protein ACI9QL_002365 [Candidatus Omnitrophota bacterium]|jgi:hypothetical protein
MQMQKRLSLFCWLLLAGFMPVQAHQDLFTNFYLNMELNRTSLVYYVEGPSSLFEPTADLKYGDPIVQQSRKEAFQTYLKTISEVAIDGIPVLPIVRSIEYEKKPASRHLAEELDLLLVYVEVEYPIKSPPKQIRMLWQRYLPEPDYGWAKISDIDQEPDRLEIELEEYGRYNYFELTPREPEYLWHAAPSFVETNLVGSASALDAPAPRAPFPTRSVGIALVFALGLLIAQARKRGWGLRLALLAAGVAATSWSYVAERPSSIAVPPEAEAIETFNQLQRNIYRAFDYVKEEDVYDALAQSVSGELLDRMYNDVYDSLIMREEGGAVCRVDQVDIQSTEFLGSDETLNQPNYRVRCTWEVHGKVRHWGHAHERTNRYAAEYLLTADADRWLIADVAVLKQERLTTEPPKATEDETVWDLP